MPEVTHLQMMPGDLFSGYVSLLLKEIEMIATAYPFHRWCIQSENMCKIGCCACFINLLKRLCVKNSRPVIQGPFGRASYKVIVIPLSYPSPANLSIIFH